MKQIEELADLGSIDTNQVAAITQHLISAEIERYARGKMITGQLFRPNRDLEGATGRVLEVPKISTGVTVAWKSEGQTIDTSGLTYSAVTFTVAKLGVGLKFTTEAIQDAKRDILADALEDAGREVAEAFDDQSIEALFNIATISSAGAATTNIAGTIICGHKGDINGESNITFIRNDSASAGSILATGGYTIVAYYPKTCAATVYTGSGATSITSKQVLQTKNKVVAKNYYPNVIEIHDNRLADMLYDTNTKFLDASAYGSTEGLLNAEIGKVFGMKVVVSNRFPQWCALVADLTHLGYHVIKRELAMRRDEITGYNQDALYFWGWSQRTFGVMMADAYAVLALGSIVPGTT